MENYTDYKNIENLLNLQEIDDMIDKNESLKNKNDFKTVKVGDFYNVGNLIHRVDPEIYKDYKEIKIIDEKFLLQALDCLKKLIDAFVERKMDKYYCAISGTLLGCWRHQGFIPSDDDVDLLILMPLYNDIRDNFEYYSKKLEPFRLMHCWIGYKIYSNDKVIIDLFIYDLKDEHYVKAGPVINSKPYFVVEQKFPFCKYHHSIMVPFQINAGKFENLLLNIPRHSRKCLELNYSPDVLKKAIVIFDKKYDLTRIYKQHKFLTSEIMDYVFEDAKGAKLPDNFFEAINSNLYRTKMLDKFIKIGSRGKQKCYITIGCFDVLHEGHKELFDIMNKYNNKIVIVHDDKSINEIKNIDVIDSLEIRIKKIKEYFMNKNSIEGLIIEKVFNKDPSKKLNEIITKYIYKYDFIYVRGNDNIDFPGIDVVKKFNIPIEYKIYKKGISSTLIRNNIKNKL